MTVSCARVIEAIEAFCPPDLALERDPTGLQVGAPGRAVRRVLCTLDLTLEVAEEAKARGCDMIVAHHAVVFRPLEALRTDTPRGRLLAALLRDDVCVYVPHTALDVAPGGGNDALARVVGLVAPRPLEGTRERPQVLVLARRASDTDAQERASFGAGALTVEHTSDLSWSVVPAARGQDVAAREALLTGQRAHVVPLASPGERFGIGRVGDLEPARTTRALATHLRDALGAPAVRVAARDPDRVVRRAAVLVGDGRRYVQAAHRAGAEALVTGDVDHHTALEALALGVDLIDVGHWAGERCVIDLLAEGLRTQLAGEPVEVLASRVSTQPFTYL